MYFESFYQHNRTIPYYAKDFYGNASVVLVPYEIINTARNTIKFYQLISISDQVGADYNDRLHFWPILRLTEGLENGETNNLIDNNLVSDVYTLKYNIITANSISLLNTEIEGTGYEPPFLGNSISYSLCLSDRYYSYYICISYRNICDCEISRVFERISAHYNDCTKKILLTLHNISTNINTNITIYVVIKNQNDQIINFSSYSINDIINNNNSVIVDVSSIIVYSLLTDIIKIVYFVINNNNEVEFINQISIPTYRFVPISLETNYLRSQLTFSIRNLPNSITDIVVSITDTNNNLIYQSSVDNTFNGVISIRPPFFTQDVLVNISYNIKDTNIIINCTYNLENIINIECYYYVEHVCSNTSIGCPSIEGCTHLVVAPIYYLIPYSDSSIQYSYDISVLNGSGGTDYCIETDNPMLFDVFPGKYVKINNQNISSFIFSTTFSMYGYTKVCNFTIFPINLSITPIIWKRTANNGGIIIAGVKFRIEYNFYNFPFTNFTINYNGGDWNIPIPQNTHGVFTWQSDISVDSNDLIINNDWLPYSDYYTVVVRNQIQSAFDNNYYKYFCSKNIYDVSISNELCTGIIKIKSELEYDLEIYDIDFNSIQHNIISNDPLEKEIVLQHNRNRRMAIFVLKLNNSACSKYTKRIGFLYEYYYFRIVSAYTDYSTKIVVEHVGLAFESITIIINNDIRIDLDQTNYNNLMNHDIIDVGVALYDNTFDILVVINAIVYGTNYSISQECLYENINNNITPYSFNINAQYNTCTGTLTYTITRTPNYIHNLRYIVSLFVDNNLHFTDIYNNNLFNITRTMNYSNQNSDAVLELSIEVYDNNQVYNYYTSPSAAFVFNHYYYRLSNSNDCNNTLNYTVNCSTYYDKIQIRDYDENILFSDDLISNTYTNTYNYTDPEIKICVLNSSDNTICCMLPIIHELTVDYNPCNGVVTAILNKYPSTNTESCIYEFDFEFYDLSTGLSYNINNTVITSQQNQVSVSVSIPENAPQNFGNISVSVTAVHNQITVFQCTKNKNVFFIVSAVYSKLNQTLTITINDLSYIDTIHRIAIVNIDDIIIDAYDGTQVSYNGNDIIINNPVVYTDCYAIIDLTTINNEEYTCKIPINYQTQ